MGGMSAWELAASRPDIFAAISPVAAHHKQEQSEWIAQRLRYMPLYVVHDTTDGTCPMAPEDQLWQLLQGKGNTQLKKHVTTGIDHCKVHEQAYCVNQDFYNFLLQYAL